MAQAKMAFLKKFAYNLCKNGIEKNSYCISKMKQNFSSSAKIF